jgi:hypothetical protein
LTLASPEVGSRSSILSLRAIRFGTGRIVRELTSASAANQPVNHAGVSMPGDPHVPWHPGGQAWPASPLPATTARGPGPGRCHSAARLAALQPPSPCARAFPGSEYYGGSAPPGPFSGRCAYPGQRAGCPLGRFAKHFNHFKDEYNRSLRLSVDGANKRMHSSKERRVFETELTILANRTGSELITTEARRYIETAGECADERRESTHEFVARIRLQAAITKALTEGPLAA